MEIKTKVSKVGNGYCLRLPKALVDSKILEPNKEYLIKEIVVDNNALSVFLTRSPVLRGVAL